MAEDARYLVPPLDMPDADYRDTLFLIADDRRTLASRVRQLLSGVTAVGGTLMIDLQGTPAPGSVLTIISSASPVIGTFRGLPEGSTVISGGQRFTISYLNNKVTLTAQGA